VHIDTFTGGADWGLRVTGRALYVASLLIAVLLAGLATAYWVYTPSYRNGDNGDLRVYGLCSMINGSLICAGSLVNGGSSIIPVENVSVSTPGYSGLVRLYPYLVVKDGSSAWFLFYLRGNGSYLFYSSDGVTRMMWRGVTSPFNMTGFESVRVFWESHGSSRRSGLIPIELNDYRFISNESCSYYGILVFNRSLPVEYVDVKLMVLHDRLAWEEVDTNVSDRVFVIPLQTFLFEAEGGGLTGYPSRVTVEYQSDAEDNTSVTLYVYKTSSVVLGLEWGGLFHNSILPILPPHLAASLLNASPYFLDISPVLQTEKAPTR
jgi:hypothetical protein